MNRIYSLLVLLFYTSSICFANNNGTNHWESILNSEAQFKYWYSDNKPLSDDWETLNFNDINWDQGIRRISNNDNKTKNEKCKSVAIRINFEVDEKSKLTEAYFYFDYNESFVAYLNGVEIMLSEEIAENNSDSNNPSIKKSINFPTNEFNHLLVEGKNTLAIQVYNTFKTSADLSSSVWLVAGLSSPEIEFQSTPEWFKAPVRLTNSNLPIVIIDTKNNKSIPDEPKLDAQMKIINNQSGDNNINDTPNEYNGTIGIELRGNSTKGFPKKPYNLETRDTQGENLNVPLFGWPQENDWVMRASYLDHTFIRNGLANYMSRLNGWWAPRTQLVELVLNGNYQGIYVFMEDIKPDEGRLDIATLTADEINEPDITGGYIWEITGFDTNMGSQRKLKYPNYNEAAPEQISYIKNYDNQFRDLMKSNKFANQETGYRNWINVESFINEILIQEAMRNSDAYGWSGYFHKDKGGKINAGPVWDFDQSAGNSSYPDDGVVEGWMFEHPSTNQTPFFWPVLFQDPSFQFAIRQQWKKLRETVFSNDNLFNYIDSVAYLLTEAQEREFTKWPVLGTKFWRETSGYRSRNTYQKEVDYLEDFLYERWDWMDYELKQYTSSDFYSMSDNNFMVYPNPVTDKLNIIIYDSKANTISTEIYNNMGIKLCDRLFNRNSLDGDLLTIDLDNNYPPGMYILKMTVNNQQKQISRFVKLAY